MPTYTLYTGGYEDHPSIAVLAFDPHHPDPDQRLRITQRLDHGHAPTWLTFSHDGSKLYITSEWGEPEGQLGVLAVTPTGLDPSATGPSVATGGLWACHTALITSTTPHLLVTSNYKGASLGVVALDAQDGAFQGTARIDVRPGRPLGPVAHRQEQAHPHGVHLDPLKRMVVVPDLGTDDLRLFRIKPVALEHPEAFPADVLEEDDAIHLEAGDGPRHVLFSPLQTSGDGGLEACLYVLNELSNSISVFRASYATAEASELPTFHLLQSRVSLLPATPMPHQSSFASWHASELVLTPDGRTLIAANRAENHDPLNGSHHGPQDLLAVFPVDQDNGCLDEAGRQLVECGGRAPRHMSLSSESIALRGQGDPAVDQGRYLAVALHDSDEVVVFERTGTDGRTLQEVARRRHVGRPGVVVWR